MGLSDEEKRKRKSVYDKKRRAVASDAENEIRRKKDKARRLSRKITLVHRRGGKCITCGYNNNLSALQFHHLGHKSFNLGNAMDRKPMAELAREVDKCILLCANCHLEHHHPEHFDWE